MRPIQDISARLTPRNITKAVRYMTQGIEDQFGQALVNLATRDYPGKPISNSLLLHELSEAEEFEKLGYPFSSPELEAMNYKERLRLYKLKNRVVGKRREIHRRALLIEHNYLAEVAKRKGILILNRRK